MTARIISTSMIILIVASAYAQPPMVWAKQITGVQSITAIDVDKKGAVYIYGNFTGTIDFDPSPTIVSLTSTGNNDIYLLKLSRNGDFIWVRQLSPGGQYGFLDPTAFKCDGDSSCYLIGAFSGIMDFNPGTPTFTMNTQTLSDGAAFVVKLDTAGIFRWAKKLDGRAQIQKITLGESGNLYITGKYSQSVDFDPDNSGTFMASPPNQSSTNAYLLKLSRNGKFRWVRRLDGPYNGEGVSLACDTISKKCCFVGVAPPGTDLDPGPGQNVCQKRCGFICEVDSGGNTLQTAAVNGSCKLTSILYDAGFLVSGNFADTVDVDPGSSIQKLYAYSNTWDALLLKLTSGLALSWVKEIEGSAYSHNTGGELALDKNGGIIYFNRYIGTYDVDPGTNVLSVTSVSTTPQATPYDYLVTEYDSNGNLLWAHSMGPCNDRTSPGYVAKNGDVYLSNTFLGAIDVDPGPGAYMMSSSPLSSLFVERLSNCYGSAVPQVTVNALPSVPICAGESVVLSAGGALTYQWSHGPKQTVVNGSPTISTMYEVMGVDSAGCAGFATYYVVVNKCTGMNELSPTNNPVYPNPTTNFINIAASVDSRIKIFDIAGMEVMATIVARADNTTIDISMLKPGIYFVVNQSGIDTESTVVIKQ
jgi:hypothetical protein